MIDVGFDDQAFLLQSRGGISRYVAQIFRLFASDPAYGVAPVAGWRWTRNEHALAERIAKPTPLPPRLPQQPQRYLHYALNAPARRQAQKATVLHHTYYHPRWLRGDPGTSRTVVTVYDMIPELMPEMFGENPHRAKGTYVRRADLVLCISHSTKHDLTGFYGGLSSPISVVHLGVDPMFSPRVEPDRTLPQPFVLYVGPRGGYKDFDVLLQALAGAPMKYAGIVAVGGGPPAPAEREHILQLGLVGKVHFVTATDAQLARLYRAAEVFVFPSRYEGFGLPTLEAMASGCPTILADSSSHPEVGGEAALYFPPGDVEALRASLNELSENESLTAQLRAEGLRRAKQFSWAATARATAAAYQSIV